MNFSNTKSFTIDEAIDLCFLTNYNFVQLILRIIISKLGLEKAVLVIEHPVKQNNQPVIKLFENPQMYKITPTGNKIPMRTRSLQFPTRIGKVTKTKESPSAERLKIHSSFLKRRDAMAGKVFEKMLNMQNFLQKMSNQIEILITNQEDLDKKIKQGFDEDRSRFRDLEIIDSDLESMAFARHVSELQEKHKKEMGLIVNNLDDTIMTVFKKINDLEENIFLHRSSVYFIDAVSAALHKSGTMKVAKSIDEKTEHLCNLIYKIDKDIEKIEDKIANIIECAKFTEKHLENIVDKILQYEKFTRYEERMKILNLWKNKVQVNFDVLTESIEHFKIIKANQDEVDELLEKKADKDLLLDLVTRDYFESLQRDIMKGINQILEQLMQDEIQWSKIRREMTNELEEKANLKDLNSLKINLNCKLFRLQKKLKDIMERNLASQATSLKDRLLKDSKCICCTMMNTEINSTKAAIPVAQHSIKLNEFKCLCGTRTPYCGGDQSLLGPNQKLISKKRNPLQIKATNFVLMKTPENTLNADQNPSCFCICPCDP